MKLDSVQSLTAELNSLTLKPKTESLKNHYRTILLAISFFVGEEFSIQLAPFYYQYGVYLAALAEDQIYRAIYAQQSNPEKTYNPFTRCNEEGSELEVALGCLDVCIQIYEEQRRRLGEGTDLQQKGEEETKRILGILIKANKKLGDILVFMGRYGEALQFYQKAKEYIQAVDSQNNKMMAEITMELANAVISNHDDPSNLQKGISLYISASEYLIKELHVQHPHLQFPAPTPHTLSVCRQPYIPCYEDTRYVKQLKSIIGQILDQIEDTQYQIEQNKQYGDIIKEVLNELKSNQQPTKEEGESPANPLKQSQIVKAMVHLGVYGNCRNQGECDQNQSISSSLKRVNEMP